MGDDERDIEGLREVEENVSVEHYETAAPKTRFVGYKTLTLATLIAALLGAFGGSAISKFMMPPVSDLGPITSKIDNVVSENKALKAQLSRLERDVKTKPAVAKVDLSGITSRLKALETAKPQIIEPASPAIDSDLVARLEALQEDGSEALDLSDIMKRLDKLETMSSEAMTAPALEQSALIEQLKSDILADDSFLQGITDQASGVAPSSVKMSEGVDKAKLLPFPKTAILDTLENAEASQTWLKRTLNKHITVQSEENPRYLVELIEMDLKDGNFSEALVKFDKLPEPAKMTAKNWRDAFEDQ